MRFERSICNFTSALAMASNDAYLVDCRRLDSSLVLGRLFAARWPCCLSCNVC